jgi:hypothetical protein
MSNPEQTRRLEDVSERDNDEGINKLILLLTTSLHCCPLVWRTRRRLRSMVFLRRGEAPYFIKK